VGKNESKITITGDNDDVLKAFDQITKKINKTEKETVESNEKIADSFDKNVGAIKKAKGAMSSFFQNSTKIKDTKDLVVGALKDIVGGFHDANIEIRNMEVQIQQLQDSPAFLAIEKDFNKITEATGGLISAQESLTVVGKLVNSRMVETGVSISNLSKQSLILAQRMGIEWTEAMTVVIDAVSEGNVEMLNSLGIMVDWDKELIILASSLGKLEGELTDQEKRLHGVKVAQDALAEATETNTVKVDSYLKKQEEFNKLVLDARKGITDLTQAIGSWTGALDDNRTASIRTQLQDKKALIAATKLRLERVHSSDLNDKLRAELKENIAKMTSELPALEHQFAKQMGKASAVALALSKRTLDELGDLHDKTLEQVNNAATKSEEILLRSKLLEISRAMDNEIMFLNAKDDQEKIQATKDKAKALEALGIKQKEDAISQAKATKDGLIREITALNKATEGKRKFENAKELEDYDKQQDNLIKIITAGKSNEQLTKIKYDLQYLAIKDKQDQETVAKEKARLDEELRLQQESAKEKLQTEKDLAKEIAKVQKEQAQLTKEWNKIEYDNQKEADKIRLDNQKSMEDMRMKTAEMAAGALISISNGVFQKIIGNSDATLAEITGLALQQAGAQIFADGTKNMFIGGGMTLLANPAGPAVFGWGAAEVAAGLAMGYSGAALAPGGGGGADTAKSEAAADRGRVQEESREQNLITYFYPSERDFLKEQQKANKVDKKRGRT